LGLYEIAEEIRNQKSNTYEEKKRIEEEVEKLLEDRKEQNGRLIDKEADQKKIKKSHV
jgi:hypothetical protein